MNTRPIIITGAVIIGVILVGYIAVSQYGVDMDTTNTQDKPQAGQQSETREALTNPGTYREYSESALNDASGPVVLFFHAKWCPTCRDLDRNITSNAGQIPEDLTILRVDFDDSDKLRQKYGVTTQHTLVQTDANGEMVKKWTLSSTLDDIINKIER